MTYISIDYLSHNTSTCRLNAANKESGLQIQCQIAVYCPDLDHWELKQDWWCFQVAANSCSSSRETGNIKEDSDKNWRETTTAESKVLNKTGSTKKEKSQKIITKEAAILTRSCGCHSCQHTWLVLRVMVPCDHRHHSEGNSMSEMEES